MQRPIVQRDDMHHWWVFDLNLFFVVGFWNSMYTVFTPLQCDHMRRIFYEEWVGNGGIFKFIPEGFPSCSTKLSSLFNFFFFFLFFQARKVKSGSYGVQQQPVLQGQPFSLQVEYTTRQHDSWQGRGRTLQKTPQLEVQRCVTPQDAASWPSVL